MPAEKTERKRTFFKYDDLQMQEALKAVKQGLMNKKQASKHFSVPRSTLVRKLSGNAPEERKMGPETVLTSTEEQALESWLLGLARKGFPVHRQNLLDTVKKIVTEKGKNNPFKDGRPGLTWFRAFLRRHPKLKEKNAEGLTKARAAVTKESIQRWFSEVETYLKGEKIEEVLKDGNRIFNADETGFIFCPKSGKVIGPSNTNEDFYKVEQNDQKQQITVMACFSASGKCVPPMIIYPYKKMPRGIVESVPENWAIGRSESGWMNGEVFYEYIANHFIEYLDGGMEVPLPVVLFVDGHRSHLTKHVSELCAENGIILVALHPNTTHMMQPADVSVFKPIKSGWTTAVRDWKFQNFPKDVTRYTFGEIIEGVFSTWATERTIRNGFRACGLFPFDPEAVDYSKCLRNRMVTNPTESVPQPNVTDRFEPKYLDYVEKKIRPERLQEFMKHYEEGGDWHGESTATELFSLWKGLKMEEVLKNLGNENDPDPIIRPEPLSFATSSTTPTMPNEVNLHEPHSGESSRSVSSVHQPSNLLSTPFKRCLLWPKTPEKTQPKRRRQLFPAVVSSSKWRQFLDSSKEKKGKKVQNKESSTTVTEDATSDWICKRCKRSWKAEDRKGVSRKWVDCDNCHATFHIKCIPKSHLQAFGIDADAFGSDDEDVSFLCHNCAHLSGDSDSG